MKIVVMVLGMIMIFSSLAFADDITDFMQERTQLQQRLAQYQQASQNIKVRLIELNALIQYVEKQKLAEEIEEEVEAE